jgi:hypothetical protein
MIFLAIAVLVIVFMIAGAMLDVPELYAIGVGMGLVNGAYLIRDEATRTR